MPTTANIAKINGIVFSGAAAASDAHTLIATATASGSATLSFTLGLDSLYDAYEFRFTNLHPASLNPLFLFQVNATDGADFNDSYITTSFFRAYQHEAGDASGLNYRPPLDHAQTLAYVTLAESTAGGAGQDDGSLSGVLTLYAPSSATYVKHFMGRINNTASTPVTIDNYVAGYINDTTPIDEISFKFSSGNIDAGQIKMYGIAKA